MSGDVFDKLLTDFRRFLIINPTHEAHRFLFPCCCAPDHHQSRRLLLVLAQRRQKSPCHKPEVFSLKDVGVHQAGRVY